MFPLPEVIFGASPNFSQKKAVIQNYLTQHNIPFSATDTKKVLYEKIKQKDPNHMFVCFCPHIFCNFSESGVHEFFNIFQSEGGIVLLKLSGVR
jgi:hypothetical protein